MADSPWYERFPARLVLEKETMAEKFPQFQLFRDRETLRLYWDGTLTSNSNSKYQVLVEYQNDFPDTLPKAFPVNPEIEIWRDERWRMHQYSDRSLCLFHPNDRFADSNTTAVLVVAAASAWLFAYEQWEASGHTIWPGIDADER